MYYNDTTTEADTLDTQTATNTDGNGDDKNKKSDKGSAQTTTTSNTQNNSSGGDDKDNKQQSDKNAKKGTLVCQGAMCQCKYGASPAQLMVTTHSKYYVNDANGAQKLVATTAELPSPFMPPFFGVCSKKPQNAPNCTPVINTWKEHSMHIMAGGKPVLLDISKATCAIAGDPDSIQIIRHGQEQSLGVGNFENADSLTLPDCNPLAPPDLNKKLQLRQVQVLVVEGKRADASKSKTDKTAKDKPIHSNDDKKEIEKLYLRSGEKAIFTATRIKPIPNKNKKVKTATGKEATEEEKQQINWIIYEGNSFGKVLYRFNHHGPQLEIILDDKGQYLIEATGNKEGDIQGTLAIEVCDNELVAIQGADDQGLLRKQTFTAVGLMPFTAEETEKLHWVVRTPNDVEEGTYIGVEQCQHAFQQEGKYTVKAWLQNQEAGEKQKTITIQANWVERVQCTPTIIRPGDNITIKTTSMHYGGDNVLDIDTIGIKWQHKQGSQIEQLTRYNGKSGFTTNLFTALGQHQVEGYTKKSNFKGLDTCTFTVTNNEAKVIITDKIPRIGRTINLSIKESIFPNILDADKQSTQWKVLHNGIPKHQSVGQTTCAYTITEKGNYKITCNMNGQTKPAKLSFSVQESYIEEAYWALSNGVKTAKAGYNQTIRLYYTAHGLNGEKLQLSIYDDDSLGDTLIHQQTITVDEKGYCEINLTDEMRKKIEAKGFMKYGKLYVQFNAAGDYKLKNTEQSFPTRTSDYLMVLNGGIVDRADIVDSTQKHPVKVLYATDILYTFCRARNLKGKKVKLYIMRMKGVFTAFNITFGDNLNPDAIIHEAEITIGNDGLASYHIAVDKLNKKPTGSEVWQIYVVYKLADVPLLGCSSEEIGYTQLLGPAAKAKAATTSPSFVVADGKMDNTDTKQCVCKQYDLIWGSKVSCEFRKKVVEICKELWPNDAMKMANGLMAVMYVETRGSFKAQQLEGWQSVKDPKSMTIDDFHKNGVRVSSRAVGLIQFTQAALVALKEYKSDSKLSVEERFDELNKAKLRFAQMGEIKQLDYVKKYFTLDNAHTKIKSAEDIYLHVFAPKGVGKDENYVLYEEGTTDYNSNKSVDTENNSDGKIQRWEILNRYRISFTQGLSNKVKEFSCGNNIQHQLEKNNGKCPSDCSQCFDYGNVVDNPRINNQSNNVNKNRFHREKRYNSKHPYPEGYYHTGVDILASLNTPLKSLLCGEIVEAYDTQGDLGKIVIVQSKDKDGIDVWIMYCHLNKISVSKGQLIKHGQVIGLSGNTGNAKDISAEHYHVHIEASRENKFYGSNKRVDPEQFMRTKFDETKNGNPLN